MTLRTNLKEQARELGFIGHAIYKVCGQAIADGIMEEFEQLVIETAQYTGSTAASWNVATKGAASHGGTIIRELGPDEDPLHAGHRVAVNIAMNANKGNLDDLARGTVKALNSGINVWNDVPWAEEAEEGDRRPENADANHAFARFQARVATKVFDPIAHVITPEELKAMTKKK